MKKAQGLPFNVIVIAALALIVLVVMIMIFYGQMRDVRPNMESCQVRKGVCKPDCLGTEAAFIGTDCGDQLCCVPTIENNLN